MEIDLATCVNSHVVLLVCSNNPTDTTGLVVLHELPPGSNCGAGVLEIKLPFDMVSLLLVISVDSMGIDLACTYSEATSEFSYRTIEYYRWLCNTNDQEVSSSMAEFLSDGF
jgi:hypothetical protein